MIIDKQKEKPKFSSSIDIYEIINIRAYITIRQLSFHFKFLIPQHLLQPNPNMKLSMSSIFIKGFSGNMTAGDTCSDFISDGLLTT